MANPMDLMSPQPKRSKGDELFMNNTIGGNKPTLHLVPSRWNPTGWKYTNVDPSGTNFFKNPNRVNAHGMSPTEAKVKRGHRQAQSPSMDFHTTYGGNFIDHK